MRNSILLVLFVGGFCYGQHNEFQTYSNGLIYDEATMNRLGAIVDSLNIRFRSCDLSHPFYSYPQGIATWVKVPNRGARNLIREGGTLEAYLERYPRSLREKELWVVKTKYNYRDQALLKYSGLPYGWGSEPSIEVEDIDINDKTSGWLLNSDGTEAFYLINVTQYELPFEYARRVQYVDCMIDTSASIFFPQAKTSYYLNETVIPNPKEARFIEWAEDYPDKPEFPDYEWLDKQGLAIDSAFQVYNEEYRVWDSLRILQLDQKINPEWKNVLKEAIEEGVTNGNPDPRLEFYATRYLSEEDVLRLMRSRIVVGSCSMDASPRYHAMNICKLAAETTQWDIFLRSHLNIMNDRFERVSDGSWAWEGRKTYLKELEMLDVDAIDLLLGTALRVENVSDNHYRGSIGRLGRALADATDKDQVEQSMLDMIDNNNLDPYNRLLVTYLFHHYASNLDDEGRSNSAMNRLEKSLAEMPSCIKAVWGK